MRWSMLAVDEPRVAQLLPPTNRVDLHYRLVVGRDEAEPFVLGVVLEVGFVEGGEGKVIGQTACGDPRVVDRAGPAPGAGRSQ
jgi:hypothetical protein